MVPMYSNAYSTNPRTGTNPPMQRRDFLKLFGAGAVGITGTVGVLAKGIREKIQESLMDLISSLPISLNNEEYSRNLSYEEAKSAGIAELLGTSEEHSIIYNYKRAYNEMKSVMVYINEKPLMIIELNNKGDVTLMAESANELFFRYELKGITPHVYAEGNGTEIEADSLSELTEQQLEKGRRLIKLVEAEKQNNNYRNNARKHLSRA